MTDLAPGRRLDQYEIADEIARTGMATLWRAIDGETGRTVVLKVPHPEVATDLAAQERFRREETIGQRLDHPAVVKILQPKRKTRPYIVKEHVEGQTLRELLRASGRLPIDRAVALAVQIADALGYVHGRGVVHRDVKPENVMVTRDGRAKLLDFGIALDETIPAPAPSRLPQAVGTPDYMAPEQVTAQRADARSDVYALGAMLYEMLTGVVPYPADDVYVALRAKSEEDPTPPRRLRPDITPALEETVLRALERDPRQRHESAFELREALAHPASVVLAGRSARQPARHRLSRTARTWLRVLAWAAVGVVFVLAFVALARLFG